MGNELGIERPLICDALQIAVATELPSVKRACKTRYAAVLVQGYAIAAMRAYVVERLDRLISLADEDEFLRAHRESEIVALFGNVAGDSR